MTFIPDYEVLHNPSAVFRPSRKLKEEVVPKSAYFKIKDSIPLDLINNENMEIEKITLEVAPKSWIKHSDKSTLIRIKTDYAKHEMDKLMSDIDKVIDKSKSISISDKEYELESM